MSRRKIHRRMTGSGRQNAGARPDTPGEMQAASLSSPFFREVWNASSKMSWQQFVARWETRHTTPKTSGSRGR
jgi:hypothetical protein